MRVYPMFFCRKQKRKQTQLKGSFMKMNSTQIYEKFYFCFLNSTQIYEKFLFLLLLWVKINSTFWSIYVLSTESKACSACACLAFKDATPLLTPLQLPSVYHNPICVSSISFDKVKKQNVWTPWKWWKKFINRGLQSNKYGAHLHIQLLQASFAYNNYCCTEG